MKNCLYCGNEVEDNSEDAELFFCSEKCRKRGVRLMNFSAKFKVPFLIIIGVGLLLLVFGSFLPAQLRLVGIGLSLVGFIAFISPFSSSQTAESFGLKKTFIVSRIISVFIVAFGVYMIIF